MRRADSPGPLVIRAVENLARCLVDEAFVNGVYRGEILVKIEMLRLNIEHNGMLGVIVDECAVAFIAFGYEPLAFRVPARICSQNRNFSSHIVAGFESSGPQDMCGHGRGRCFSVHTGDHDSFFGVHDRSQRIGAARQRKSESDRLIVSGIPRFDRGRVNNDIRSMHALRRVGTMKMKTLFDKASDLGGINLVGSAHLVSEPQQQRCNAAHARTRHSNEVDVLRRCRSEGVA